MTSDDVKLREYIEALLIERDRFYTERDQRYAERWTAAEAEFTRFIAQLEERLHTLNELRSGVLTRQEFEAKHEVLTKEISLQKEELIAQKQELVVINSSAHTKAVSLSTTIAILGATSGFVFIVVALLTHGFK